MDPESIYASLLKSYENLTGTGTTGGGVSFTTVLERGLDPEQMAAHPEVQRVINERVKCLIDASERILDAMIQTPLPYGLRWICRQLDTMARTTFKDATESQIAALIGGFVFLRYINPVIVAPESINIVTKKPSPQARKNLMMVAKCMQNLSNSQFFTKDKKDLQPLNRFLTKNLEKIHRYFKELCKVRTTSCYLYLGYGFDEVLQTSKRRSNIFALFPFDTRARLRRCLL